ncbi:Uncharacterised protein [Yersinia enterocolitica]|nr:Uncharacterised protein [Yersinia enterocolitica]
MSAQRDIHRHAGTHVLTEYFNNLTHSFSTAGRALGQLDHHHIPHPRAIDGIRWDQNIKTQAAIIRHHKTRTRISKIAPDNLAGFRY